MSRRAQRPKTSGAELDAAMDQMDVEDDGSVCCSSDKDDSEDESPKPLYTQRVARARDVVPEIGCPFFAIEDNGEHKHKSEIADWTRVRRYPDGRLSVGRTVTARVIHVEACFGGLWVGALTDSQQKNATAVQEGLDARDWQGTALLKARVGAPCVVKRAGGWRRALVEAKHADKDEFSVRFVDLGDAARVALADLFELSDKLVVKPRGAVLVRCVDLTPADDARGWSDAAAAHAKRVLLNKQVFLRVLGVASGGAYTVQIVDEQGEPRAHDLALRGEVGVAEDAPPPPPLHLFAKPQVDQAIGRRLNVYRTCGRDPERFFVQLEEMTSVVKEVHRSLIAGKRPLACFEPGVACVAQYDGKWYRAEVLSATEDEAAVHFVDFGNEETMKRAEVFELNAKKQPHAALRRERLAIECRLHGARPITDAGYCDVARRLFKKLAPADKPLPAIIVSRNGDLYALRLFCYDGSDWLSSELIENGVALPRQPSAPQPFARSSLVTLVGQMVEGVRTVGASPDEFYVQLVDWLPARSALRLRPGTRRLTGVSDGRRALANWDGRWMRCETYGPPLADRTRCFFVDTGHTARLALRNVFELDEGQRAEAQSTPALAVKCLLADVAPVEGAVWSGKARRRFDQLLSGGEVADVQVVAADAAGAGVRLFVGGRSVAGRLVELGVANWTSDDAATANADLDSDTLTGDTEKIAEPSTACQP